MNFNDTSLLLNSPDTAIPWLRSLRLNRPDRAFENLIDISRAGLPHELMPTLLDRLREYLPAAVRADDALDGVARFIGASRSPLAVGTLIERDGQALETLLQLFGSSPLVAEWMIADPESYDLLRMAGTDPVDRDSLVQELCEEVNALSELPSALRVLRRFQRREISRIVFGDLVHRQAVSTVTAQLSFVADAVCEAALRTARRAQFATRGVPRRSDGVQSAFVVLGLGRVGGTELGYADELDLVCLYESEGHTDGPKPLSNAEYFSRLADEFRSLLTLDTELGPAYAVSFQCRPLGESGPLASSADRALHYYDTMGRTWERQAYVKARVVAGDHSLGREFLSEMEPWIYRRFLNRADVAGVHAMKRRIERKARLDASDNVDAHQLLETIRDLEQVVQFLQLINGGPTPAVRVTNTWLAIQRLEETGCLVRQEAQTLLDSYSLLRTAEHRIHVGFASWPFASLDEDEKSRRLNSLWASTESSSVTARESWPDDFFRALRDGQSSIQSLLHESFGNDTESVPEADLILDPLPADVEINSVLAPYGFHDKRLAYRHLTSLATERIRFLSTRRCRYFLSLIARHLLTLIGKTPEPDRTLESLCQVSDSVGGKGILWELFSASAATLDLYVRLCAGSPYLTSILTGNPGMLDDLMDSLVVNKLPDRDRLRTMLDDLSRGAGDPLTILQHFKDLQHLVVGVRDLLGKEDIQNSLAFLADVAHVSLERIAGSQFELLSERFGVPSLHRAHETCEFALVALGKLGGREPNYHSNFDLLMVYQADGATVPAGRRSSPGTSNQHFFNELARRIVQQCGESDMRPQLFDVNFDMRMAGTRNALSVPFDEFAQFFQSGRASIHERQSLCRARPIFGSEALRSRVQDLIGQILRMPLESSDREALRQARRNLEPPGQPWNLKRSPGGTMDVEHVCQVMQLQHARVEPNVLATGTLEGLARLRDFGFIESSQANSLIDSYRYLRGVEARLRLMNATARHTLPTDPSEIARLVYLLGAESEATLRCECRRHMERIRGISRIDEGQEHAESQEVHGADELSQLPSTGIS
jgi:glutamate-ammonia-ligase adenylyltransferase